MSGYRSADYTIERIADLLKLDFGEFTQIRSSVRIRVTTGSS